MHEKHFKGDFKKVNTLIKLNNLLQSCTAPCSAFPYVIGCCFYLKSDLYFMAIKSCAWFTVRRWKIADSVDFGIGNFAKFWEISSFTLLNRYICAPAVVSLGVNELRCLYFNKN